MVAKVKKKASGAGRRNVKAAKGKGRRSAAAAPSKGRKATQPAARYAVKPLDPQRKCGPGTSVQFLYRVDERTVEGRLTTHLVFFDRHGWYCEHGRACPAVGPARKHSGQIARAS